MSMASMTFHHMGLLTRRMDAASAALKFLGYTPGQAVYDPLQQATLCMAEPLRPGEPRIELIEPGEENGGLQRLLQRRDDYIYHCCYEVRGMDASLAELERAGLSLTQVSPPKAALLFGGRRVSFYVIEGLGLTEFLEQD